MYEYEKESKPLNVQLLPNIDVLPDNLPVEYPYVPRLCKEKGHMLIWYGTKETESDIAEDCLKVKKEFQWISCSEEWKIEKAVVLLWPYENEVILGAVKYPGYMKKRSKVEIRNLLRQIWKDLIIMFGDRKIICPTGSYFDYIHLYMNQMRIAHESYHWKIMKQNKFVREGDFWIRYPSGSNN